MTKVSVLSQTGASVGEIELNDAIFGIEPNEAVLFDAVIAQRASLRQGNHKVKNRSEVAGGGRKPWRQKGTGRARQGSIRSPQWRGGGIVFGPTPRDYNFKLNKKVKQLARKSALSQKAIDNAIVVVEDFNFEAPSTKAFVNVLNNLKVSEKKQLFVLPSSNKAVYLSARNLKGTQMAIASDINTYGIMNAEVLVVTESSLEVINNTLNKTKEA